MVKFLEHLLSSVAHAFVAAVAFGCLYLVFHSPLVALFPIGLYYGRESLDNNRNYYEALKAAGLSGDEARAKAQGWRGWVPFWGWTLDGILDFVLPALAAGGLAWLSLNLGSR